MTAVALAAVSALAAAGDPWIYRSASTYLRVAPWSSRLSASTPAPWSSLTASPASSSRTGEPTEAAEAAKDDEKPAETAAEAEYRVALLEEDVAHLRREVAKGDAAGGRLRLALGGVAAAVVELVRPERAVGTRGEEGEAARPVEREPRGHGRERMFGQPGF